MWPFKKKPDGPRVLWIEDWHSERQSFHERRVEKLHNYFCVRPYEGCSEVYVLLPGGQVRGSERYHWESIDPVPGLTNKPYARRPPEEKIWLWKNGDHFWAFRHLYPCQMDGGDPQTLGEPFGWAILKPSAPPASGPHKDDKP
jgi:hypothetical protein